MTKYGATDLTHNECGSSQDDMHSMPGTFTIYTIYTGSANYNDNLVRGFSGEDVLYSFYKY